MGYNGFIEFRNALRNNRLGIEQDDLQVNGSSEVRALMQEVVEKNYETMQETLNLVSDQYDKVVAAMEKANFIIMIGNGDAIIPCIFLSYKLMKLGKKCQYYSDQDLQAYCVTTIGKKDLLLTVSHTGRSKSVVEAARVASEKGAVTVAVTATAKSPLTRYCQYVLHTGTKDPTTTGEILTRRIGEQVILETLYEMLRRRTDRTIHMSQSQRADFIARQKLTDDQDVPESEGAGTEK